MWDAIFCTVGALVVLFLSLAFAVNQNMAWKIKLLVIANNRAG
jgi:hypothetical protein